MGRLVRVFKGQWSKSQQGVWRFDQDPSVMARTFLLEDKEEIEVVRSLLRGVFHLPSDTPMHVTFQLPQWMLEPDGDTCPPHNIVSSADIEMLMSVHEWNTEPKLCVMFGAEDVAKYQFVCRTPFKIGRWSFLANGVSEEQHMALVRDIIRGQEIQCSEQVLSEVFGQEKLVLLYRFSMEIEKAKNCLDLNVRAQADVGDHIVPSVDNQVMVTPGITNGIPTNAMNDFAATTDNAVSPVSVLRNTQTPAMYGGSSAAYNPHDDNRYWEMRAGYWESLMASNYALQVGRIYGVPGSENLGYPPTDLNIGRSGHTIRGLNDNHFAVTSSGSSTEAGGFGEMKGLRGAISNEKGESSARGVVDSEIKVESKEATEEVPPGDNDNTEADVGGRTGRHN